MEENNTYEKVNLDKLFELSLTHQSIEVTIDGQNKSFVNQSYIEPMITNKYIVKTRSIVLPIKMKMIWKD